jgi:hypothetical protein
MDTSAPNLEQQNTILTSVYQTLRQRRPELFRRGEPWRPGGVWELRDHLGGLIEAARAAAGTPERREPCLRIVRRHVCRRCDHQTPCGYCPVRDRNDCVLEQEACVILSTTKRCSP